MLTIHTKRIRRSDNTDNQCRKGQRSQPDFSATIKFCPKGYKTMISLRLAQHLIFQGALTPVPRLTVCNIIRNDSKIFELAYTGRLNDIMTLVTQGKASIWDHDETGRSLLHVRRLVITLSTFNRMANKIQSTVHIISNYASF